MKTVDDETKNEKAKYNAYKERQNEYEEASRSILSTAMARGNEFP